MKVIIDFSEKEVEAELFESDLTVQKLKTELPFGNRAHVSEGEVYVSLPVVGEPGEEISDFSPGDICFWQEANAILFVLGRTKLSTDDKPKFPDSMTLMGKISGDLNQLKSIEHRDKIVIRICGEDNLSLCNKEI